MRLGSYRWGGPLWYAPSLVAYSPLHRSVGKTNHGRGCGSRAPLDTINLLKGVCTPGCDMLMTWRSPWDREKPSFSTACAMNDKFQSSVIHMAPNVRQNLGSQAQLVHGPAVETRLFGCSRRSQFDTERVEQWQPWSLYQKSICKLLAL